ncbi:MAG: hypothetical protein U0L18_05270 [Acutalibacteraceae bacterium]|nr:hypothetical protein [Acutalibacteraceae bacterium]
MKEEKIFKIYYGEGKEDYITRYLKEEDIINGYLTESKAFNIFYSDMIMSNNYIQNNYDNLEILISGYNEKDDYYEDEYQIFIINPEYDEEMTIKATEKMGNTLYYDNKNKIYLTGITDLGTNRSYVSTNLKVEECNND